MAGKLCPNVGNAMTPSLEQEIEVSDSRPEAGPAATTTAGALA